MVEARWTLVRRASAFVGVLAGTRVQGELRRSEAEVPQFKFEEEQSIELTYFDLLFGEGHLSFNSDACRSDFVRTLQGPGFG